MRCTPPHWTRAPAAGPTGRRRCPIRCSCTAPKRSGASPCPSKGVPGHPVPGRPPPDPPPAVPRRCPRPARTGPAAGAALQDKPGTAPAPTHWLDSNTRSKQSFATSTICLYGFHLQTPVRRAAAADQRQPCVDLLESIPSRLAGCQLLSYLPNPLGEQGVLDQQPELPAAAPRQEPVVEFAKPWATPGCSIA